MTRHRRPLKRTMLVGGGLFVICLCLILSIQGAVTFSRTIFNRYNAWLTRIIAHVEHVSDADDLYHCYQTGEHSARFDELQERLNMMVDDFELMYLYVVYPDVDRGVMINVISATSEAEFAAGEENMAIGEETDAYPPEELRRYADCLDNEGAAFFFEKSDWGECYTAAKPLRNSDGVTFALICADIPTDYVRHSVLSYVLWNVCLIVAIGILFSVLMYYWVRRNITDPVRRLEQSAMGFAQKSHVSTDPAGLTFDAPEIHTGNELESLSGAIAKMADDMRSYVEGILSAEQRATTAEKEAYQDALTHVKSKAAYNGKVEELNRQIRSGGVQFAVVMADLDDLKGINDNYGHEHGDDYIIGTCGIVARVYKHSPVYRVGGDEFVAILQGDDYVRRDELLAQVLEEFRKARTGPGQPWEKYSASVGMAVYSGAEGQTVEDVLAQADEIMYRRKRQAKGENAPRE